MGAHLRELSESYAMNTNTAGFKCFSKVFAFVCALDESSLDIGGWWWPILLIQRNAKNLKKITETLAHVYSSESTERERIFQ